MRKQTRFAYEQSMCHMFCLQFTDLPNELRSYAVLKDVSAVGSEGETIQILFYWKSVGPFALAHPFASACEWVWECDRGCSANGEGSDNKRRKGPVWV